MLVDETVAAHWSLVCEITRLERLLAMAFLKFPTPAPAAEPTPATDAI
jgi:hypothetical protein